MTLKVIGVGFGRTGTMSLKLALEELGFGPCYHMAETIAHPEHDAMWLALAKGKTRDWRPILTPYAATVDWPGVMIWRELVAANPQAKIILSVRDPEDWYASAAATIFVRMLEFDAARGDPNASIPSAAVTWRWSTPWWSREALAVRCRRATPSQCSMRRGAPVGARRPALCL